MYVYNDYAKISAFLYKDVHNLNIQADNKDMSVTARATEQCPVTDTDNNNSNTQAKDTAVRIAADNAASHKVNVKVFNLKLLRSLIGILGFIAMPVVSFYLFEYVTGNLQTIISQEAIFYNICFNFCIYLVLLGISGSTRIAVPIASVFLFILSLAETFVFEFRDRPIMFWDFTALGTAMTVAENYVFELSDAMKHSALIIAVLNILLLFFPFKVKRLRSRAALFVFCFALSGGFCYNFFTRIVPTKNLELNLWNINDTYAEDGYILSTAVSMRYFVKQAPAGYSHAKLKAIVDDINGTYDSSFGKLTKLNNNNTDINQAAAGSDSLSDNNTANSDILGSAVTQPVNLICIMNESFSDLSVAGDFTTNIDYMPFWHSLSENAIRGSLCVPVFGSMTSNTEAEFLTGDSMALLPFNSNAYQFNIKPGALSMVSTLKSQGYRAVAMHPYPAENWNRKRVYENFGFDEFDDIEYYELDEQLRNYVCDASDFARLIEQVENKKSPDEKLFLFNVTMQNHGGYLTDYDNFEQEIVLAGDLAGKYPEAEQYLSLIKKTDEAFEGLINYFKNYDEPTMIVMFGDHQPSVENEFYDEIAGISSYDVPAKDRLMWYQTPFVIWTNYEQPSADIGKLSSLFLSSYVLKAAGLELTPYNKYLLKLSENVPIIHPLGCYDSDDNFYTWDESTSPLCPYAAAILNYEYLAYNHSLDSKKYTAAFSLDTE